MSGGGLSARFRGRFGGFDLQVGFEAPERGVTALFGPSGSGKTTLLRCLAGLDRVVEGCCRLGDAVWQDAGRFLPPHRRAVGYVFQEPSLFAHLSVRDNLAYGLRRAAGRAGAGEVGFDQAVALLGLEPLLARAPAKLSGGERQRVAIGRALLAQPRLVLMDEPLAALDRASRAELLPRLEAVFAALAVPVIYVSHDLAEVERLADHLVLLERGRVVAAGPLLEVQADPSLPIARLPEAGVSLPAEVEGVDAGYGLVRLAVAGGRLMAPGPAAAIGARCRVRIAAGDVSLARTPPAACTILNILPARILAAEPEDRVQMMVALALGGDGEGARILARVSRRSWEGLGLAVGQDVYAQIKALALTPPSLSESGQSS